MNRDAQIAWWVEQVEAARRAVSDASQTRRRRSLGLDDEIRARRGPGAPPPKTPAAHQIIRGETITGGRDDERTRSLPVSSGGGGGGAGAAAQSGSNVDRIDGGGGLGGSAGRGAGHGGADGRARQLAAGYQPAVIKVVSYARGVARATATGQYVQREDVALETHDGRLLADRQAVADEIKAWSTILPSGRRARTSPPCA